LEIVDFARQAEGVLEQAATLLVSEFDQPRGWPTLGSAREEVDVVIRSGFALGVLEGDLLSGWVGGLPQLGGRVWELHPMVVRREHRRCGVGRPSRSRVAIHRRGHPC
jgi:aminoglycoside 6'-N-acetyltransferase I